MEQTCLEVDARPARLWRGGQGPGLLLLHGGWHGARAHWGPVWDALSRRYRVIAPEIPGIGDTRQQGLPRFADHAPWLAHLLDALAVDRALVVGNSFGGTLAWDFASRFPKRCRGLVLVNGAPAPRLSPVVHALLSRFPLRPLLAEVLREGAWSPRALNRAFANPRLIPEEIRRTVSQARPRQRQAVMRLTFDAANTGGLPGCPKLLLWGEADRLPGATPNRARTLQHLIGARLDFIPGAGHLPQVEQPELFVKALAAFDPGRGDASDRRGVRDGSPDAASGSRSTVESRPRAPVA